MTRINTNVSSLIAQTNLGRVNADLQIRLTRLSTGLRINSGKDDPAGLIASENLRRDIRSIEKAISNTERANQVIATADSALNQVSGLLNDIRALVVEAANSGAVSDEQIAANQLQVDSILNTINRIAGSTSFQGTKLLNGNYDYTASGVTTTDLNDVRVNAARVPDGDDAALRRSARSGRPRGGHSRDCRRGGHAADPLPQVGGRLRFG